MEHRPRLTYAIQYFDHTGSMRAPYLVCKAFVESGWVVDIHTTASPLNKEIGLVWERVPVYKINGMSRRVSISKLVASLLRKRRNHIVISFIWDWHCYALMLAKILFNSPYVIVLDTYIHRSGATLWRRLREELQYGLLMRHANIILAESPDAYDAARLYAKHSIVLHVPFCLWRKDLEAVELKWLQEGFRPQRQPVILYAGRLVERKHVHDLIEAFSQLVDQFPNWTLEIRGLPGSNSYYQCIKKLIDDRGLGEKVQLLPSLSGEALYRRYRETAVFALPSEGEGMPTTITEAMFFGGAIVAGRSGAVAYQLDNGWCGCLHAAGDLGVLTQHLRDLLASETLRQEYMERARQRMLTHFVWEAYFPELEAEFRRLVCY